MTVLPHRPLGDSGLEVSALALGSWQTYEHIPREQAIAVMTALNRAASEAMVAAGAHAATDITGFGLVGHLLNMRVGAEIRASSVPLLEGVRALAERGLFPSGSGRNHEAARGVVDWQVPELEQRILTDAQTSGGLLVALPPGSAFEAGVEIGRVTGGDRIRVIA